MTSISTFLYDIFNFNNISDLIVARSQEASNLPIPVLATETNIEPNTEINPNTETEPVRTRVFVRIYNSLLNYIYNFFGSSTNLETNTEPEPNTNIETDIERREREEREFIVQTTNFVKKNISYYDINQYNLLIDKYCYQVHNVKASNSKALATKAFNKAANLLRNYQIQLEISENLITNSNYKYKTIIGQIVYNDIEYKLAYMSKFELENSIKALELELEEDYYFNNELSDIEIKEMNEIQEKLNKFKFDETENNLTLENLKNIVILNFNNL